MLRELSDRLLASRLARASRTHAAWLAYGVVALACTAYLDIRAQFIPRWGQWYATDGAHEQPNIFLQIRAWLSGRLSLFPHPNAVVSGDYVWGRGGMHTVWGLGVPILALPFHLLGLLFRAPGFPDHVRFLIFYAATTVVLARALHVTSRREPNALSASCAAAAFMMTFPTFVGLIVARFQIYDQTIATGALWSLLLLSGLLALLHRCTPLRFAMVCGAAAFSLVLRPTLAVYGLSTIVLATIVAHRKNMRPPAFAGGVAAAASVTALYFVANWRRFGSPFNGGYANVVTGPFVNRLLRWGLPFSKVPWTAAAREMYETAFRLDPVTGADGPPPPSIRPYAIGERWREYYSPGYDRLVLAGLIAAMAIVGWRLVRHRLWRREIHLEDERATVIGAWALPPAIVLLVFYARAANMVTRYLVDMYPAFAAALLCVGMAAVDRFRRRAPNLVPWVQMAMAGAVAFYDAGWRGWPAQLSRPVDRGALLSKIAEIDARAQDDMPPVPSDFKCGERRGPRPIRTHLDAWRPDCFFRSGMVFAMPYSPCVSFTLRTGSGTWGPAENESLAGFRAVGDFDPLASCGEPATDGDTKIVTMCAPHPPPFLLDGLRLYSVASLGNNLNPIDRLKLVEIEASNSCKGN